MHGQLAKGPPICEMSDFGILQFVGIMATLSQGGLLAGQSATLLLHVEQGFVRSFWSLVPCQPATGELSLQHRKRKGARPGTVDGFKNIVV